MLQHCSAACWCTLQFFVVPPKPCHTIFVWQFVCCPKHSRQQGLKNAGRHAVVLEESPVLPKTLTLTYCDTSKAMPADVVVQVPGLRLAVQAAAEKHPWLLQKRVQWIIECTRWAGISSGWALGGGAAACAHAVYK